MSKAAAGRSIPPTRPKPSRSSPIDSSSRRKSRCNPTRWRPIPPTASPRMRNSTCRASRTCSSCAPRSKDNGAAIRRHRKNMSICRITIGRCRASDSERKRLWPNEFPRRVNNRRPFRIAQMPSEREVTIMQKWRNEAFVDVVNLIFGAWLFAAPWLYGFASGAAGWNAWIMGALIALVAIAALAAFAEWEEWINLVLGLWVLVAPWALAFTENTSATGNHVVVGIVVAVLAAIELWLVHRKPPHGHALAADGAKPEGRRPPALSTPCEPAELSAVRHLHGAVSLRSIAVSSPLMAKSL